MRDNLYVNKYPSSRGQHSCVPFHYNDRNKTNIHSYLCGLFDFSGFSSVLKSSGGSFLSLWSKWFSHHDGSGRINAVPYILLVLLCLLTPLISAQQIRLPDETILGHVEITPDSLDLKVDISEYHGFSNPERLAYKPILNKKMPGLDSHRYKFFTQLVGRGYMLTDDDTDFNMAVDFKFGIESLKIPELNLFGGFFLADYGEGFKTQKINANWEPMVNYGDLRVRPTVFFKNSVYEKELIIERVNIPVYRDYLGDLDKSNLTSAGISIVAQPRIYKPLQEIRIAGEYFDHKVEQFSIIDSEQFFEFDGSLALSEMGIISDIELNTYQRFENIQGETNFFFNVPFLDLLGVNASYSEKVFPSIYLSKNFYVSPITEISIANQPYLDTKSIKYYHDYYPFINPEMIEYAPQIPLNLFFAFSLYTPVEIQLSYNLQYIENYIFLNIPENDFYNWSQDQVMKNTIALDLRKHIDDFTIRFKSNFMLSDFMKENELDNLPWEAHIVNSLSGEYTWNKKLTFLLGGDLLMGRYSPIIGDDDQETLPDAFKLYSKIDYDINKNFKAFVSIANYFTKKDEYYCRIEGLHKEEFTAEAGVRVLF